jgi:hypothetical protein
LTSPAPTALSARALVQVPAALRSVYLWAGRATVDLQRVKLPDIPVDEEAHLAAYAPPAAADLAARGLNCAFLSMNWGFPPEIEEPHWDDFTRAAGIYHAAGFRVLGYVQASNCVVKGSYAARDWYATTPDGRAVPYYAGRRMTCLNHPGWLSEVRAHACRVIERGGDGVFFDNIWMGATAWTLGGRLGGFAGCACDRCRAAYREASGRDIPPRLDAGEASRDYLRWRCGVLAQRLEEWAAAVRERAPGAWIVANNCDVILRDSGGLFGIDPPRVARCQDGLLVENVAMARYKPRTRRLIANALPIKALRALVPDRPVLALTYEQGIGLDGRPSGTRLVRALAEAVAVGASPVLKGSEFLDTQGRMTVLTSADFAPVREAAARFLGWLRAHEHLYRDTCPDPDVLVYLDEEAWRERWAEVAPATCAVAVALLAEGVPFEFVANSGLAAGVPERPILVPPGLAPPALAAGSTRAWITLPEGFLDIPAAPSRVFAGRLVRRAADRPLRALARHYFGSARVRRLLDRSGVTARFLESALFTVPRRARELRLLLERGGARRVESAAPVLVERRGRDDGTRLLHLVNYADDPQTVHVREAGARLAAWSSPDASTRVAAEGEGARVALDTYVVLEWRQEGHAGVTAGS